MRDQDDPSHPPISPTKHPSDMRALSANLSWVIHQRVHHIPPSNSVNSLPLSKFGYVSSGFIFLASSFSIIARSLRQVSLANCPPLSMQQKRETLGRPNSKAKLPSDLKERQFYIPPFSFVPTFFFYDVSPFLGEFMALQQATVSLLLAGRELKREREC